MLARGTDTSLDALVAVTTVAVVGDSYFSAV